MGKGSRVGGSGWAGVHGSMIGTGRGFPGPKPSFAKKQQSKKRKPKKCKQPSPNKKGHGLTIAEQVRAGEKKIGRITSEIKKTEKKLLELNRQLESAKSDLERARNQPRRTALGQALYEASKAPEQNSGPKKSAKTSNPIRSVEQQQRDAAKSAKASVEIEVRAGGRLKLKRIGVL